MVGGTPPLLSQWGLNVEGFVKDSCSKYEDCDSKFIKEDLELQKRPELVKFENDTKKTCNCYKYLFV